MKKWFLALLTPLLISSCVNARQDDTYGLGLRFMNYNEKSLGYVAVQQPGNDHSGGGGASFNPYSGGNGVMCCMAVPKTWRSDLKAEVVYSFDLEDKMHHQIVPIPYYGGNKIGDMYVIIHPDDTAEVVVSMVSPNDQEWKGSIKGYPVPSLAYRELIWDREMKEALDDLNLFSKSDKNNSAEIIIKIKERIKHLENIKP